MQIEWTCVSVNREMAIKQLEDNNKNVGERKVYGDQGYYMYSITVEELSDARQNEIIDVLENVSAIHRKTEKYMEAEYLENEYIVEGKVMGYEGYYEELKKIVE